MNRKLLMQVASLILILMYSCQEDSYTFPKATVNQYVIDLSASARLTVFQQSLVGAEISPFSSKFIIENVSEGDDLSLAGMFQIYDGTGKSLKNVTAHKLIDDVELIAKTQTDTLVLKEQDSLLNESNTSFILFKLNQQEHSFSGFYSGEFNFYQVADTSFIESIRVQGYVDYQGLFDFYNENETSQKALFQGNFNSQNLITGKVLNTDASEYAIFKNEEAELIRVSGTKLIDTTRILINGGAGNATELFIEFNLTKN